MSILHWSKIPEAAVKIMHWSALSGEIPSQINRSRSVTLHKKGPVKDPNNFRVIAVTNSLIKIYEKFLFLHYRNKMMTRLQTY